VSTTGNLEAAREAILAKIDAERDNLIALSKFIHANPEIALQEVKASAACADFLAERGFSVERGVADLPTAFHASTGEGRPHVGYLSEYDALPGVGHGCGHNLIAIAGIGAGIGLAAAAATRRRAGVGLRHAGRRGHRRQGHHGPRRCLLRA